MGAKFELTAPTPDQEAYLRSCEDRGYDPSAMVGGPNYEQQARYHLSFLRKCRNEAEEIEYLVALLRVADSRGAMRGVEDVRAALTRAQDEGRK